MDVGTQRELLALLRVIARAQVVIAEVQAKPMMSSDLVEDAASVMDRAVDDLDKLEEERRREEVTRG